MFLPRICALLQSHQSHHQVLLELPPFLFAGSLSLSVLLWYLRPFYSFSNASFLVVWLLVTMWLISMLAQLKQNDFLTPPSLSSSPPCLPLPLSSRLLSYSLPPWGFFQTLIINCLGAFKKKKKITLVAWTLFL